MTLRIRKPHDELDTWETISDERTWFSHTHEVDDEDLIVFVHMFRRMRERADQHHDRLLWKHHTSKVAPIQGR